MYGMILVTLGRESADSTAFAFYVFAGILFRAQVTKNCNVKFPSVAQNASDSENTHKHS